MFYGKKKLIQVKLILEKKTELTFWLQGLKGEIGEHRVEILAFLLWKQPSKQRGSLALLQAIIRQQAQSSAI